MEPWFSEADDAVGGEFMIDGRRLEVLVTRDALQTCLGAGPTREEMRRAYAAHSPLICEKAEALLRAGASPPLRLDSTDF